MQGSAASGERSKRHVGTSWTEDPMSNTLYLRSIVGFTAEDIWISGPDGALLRRD